MHMKKFSLSCLGGVLIFFWIIGLAVGSEGKKALPREFKGVFLLMTPKEVKKTLKQTGIKFKEKSGIGVSTLPYYQIYSTKAMKGYQIFSYHFYEKKLQGVRVEYNLHETKIEFDQYLSDLKEKYGEPAEEEVRGDNPLGYKIFIYKWRDDQTELDVAYTPPVKDPFGRSAIGTINWTIYDKELIEKGRKELKEKAPWLQKKKASK